MLACPIIPFARPIWRISVMAHVLQKTLYKGCEPFPMSTFVEREFPLWFSRWCFLPGYIFSPSRTQQALTHGPSLRRPLLVLPPPRSSLLRTRQSPQPTLCSSQMPAKLALPDPLLVCITIYIAVYWLMDYCFSSW